MFRSTAYLHFRAHLSDPDRDTLVSSIQAIPLQLACLAMHVSTPTRRSRGAGDLMVLTAFADADAAETARGHSYVTSVVKPLLAASCESIEVVRYQQGAVELREPDIAGGLHRTLAVSVDQSVEPEALALFESQLAAMGHYIEEIRNCSLSKVERSKAENGPRWDYVWEQEYRAIGDITGPYMDHPYHWAVVDPWFDPQSPTRILNARYLHSVCSLPSSILALPHTATNPFRS